MSSEQVNDERRDEMGAEPEYVAETLAWCNERRVEQGKRRLGKLPKGIRRIGTSCPCGKSTGLHVGREFYGPDDWHLDSPLPKPVRDFVRNFDDGRLPQYEGRE